VQESNSPWHVTYSLPSAERISQCTRQNLPARHERPRRQGAGEIYCIAVIVTE
jgi:hypothetical protein